MKYYYTICHESRDRIDFFETIEDARAAIAEYEERDRLEGCYEDGYYEIANENRETIEYHSQRLNIEYGEARLP